MALSIEDFKKALGSKASSLSEAEIERRRDIQDKFADVIFDVWLKKRNRAKTIPASPLLMLPEKSGILQGQ